LARQAMTEDFDLLGNREGKVKANAPCALSQDFIATSTAVRTLTKQYG
jgi:hypothetical protein